MKLHILSDVHLEFGKWPRAVDINAIEADVTILAGDIGVGLQGIEWALSIDRPVIYVMGNHEFYGQRPMLDLWCKAREKVEHTHVHLLENEAIIIDGVRFLGCTLWTDFAIFGADQQAEMMEAAKRTMSDYQEIHVHKKGPRHDHISIYEYGQSRITGDRLTPRKTLSLHHESRDFIERELARLPDMSMVAEPWTRTVVVTHHAPSGLSLTYQKPVNKTDAAYASNLDALVEKADLWVHGHTHVFADYRIGSGRVVSNPRGYVGNGAVHDFNPALVIDLSAES